MFDLRTMYLGTDFMEANQYGVSNLWLLTVIILFAVVLHYSVTLQYSAYFHIYFNIALKYEKKIHSDPGRYKKKDVVWIWLKGITKNPFKSEEELKEEENAPHQAG